MTCACGARGLVVMRYQDGTPFDVGVCACRRGQVFRTPQAFALLASHYGVSLERVYLLEELADDAAELATWGLTNGAVRPTRSDFLQAGQVGPKAHL